MLLSLYNNRRFTPLLYAGMTVEALPPYKRPSACLGCGNCSNVCPQRIDVPAALAKFERVLEKLSKWENIFRERAKQRLE